MPSQVVFPDNSQIAFILVSQPNELIGNRWADQDSRSVLIGLRRQAAESPAAQALSAASRQRECSSGGGGGGITTLLAATIADDMAKVMGLLADLHQKGLLSEPERTRAELGLRARPRLQPTFALGAGI